MSRQSEYFQLRCPRCMKPVGEPVPNEFAKGVVVAPCAECAHAERQRNLCLYQLLWKAVRDYCRACGGDPDMKATETGDGFWEAVRAIDDIASLLPIRSRRDSKKDQFYDRYMEAVQAINDIRKEEEE